MVHVKKCPYGKRGRPSTEFYKNGKPQIYCMGWMDCMTESPIEECRHCKDFVMGTQIELDIEENKDGTIKVS